MRKFMIVLIAVSALSACAYAQNAVQETKTTVPKGKSKYAKMHTDYRLYNADTNSMVDVDAALARAKQRGTKALIVIGANWCHDSRGLAARFDKPKFQTLIADNYELVYVSAGTRPGQRTENRAVSQRFGVDQISGTPTVFIVNGDGAVLNTDSAGYWRHADNIPTDMSYAYFDMYAKK